MGESPNAVKLFDASQSISSNPPENNGQKEKGPIVYNFSNNYTIQFSGGNSSSYRFNTAGMHASGAKYSIGYAITANTKSH